MAANNVAHMTLTYHPNMNVFFFAANRNPSDSQQYPGKLRSTRPIALVLSGQQLVEIRDGIGVIQPDAQSAMARMT